MKLFNEYTLGDIKLNNRVVMAPMTRSRAIDNIPNELMAEYYAQRAAGGLLITEGTSPSPNGLGYPRIPGIFNQAQIDGWKLVTSAVHDKGGKIFLQIMHTGRIGHPNNLPEGGVVLGPSPVVAKGEMYTDSEGPKEHPVPKEMSKQDIDNAINEYAQAAKNAVEAGFDGVEVHAANGYLCDQFLNPGSNQRTDEYGGSYQNRARFTIEVAKKTVEAIGADKTGIRVSPYGAFNDLYPFDETEVEYEYLAQELNKLGLTYIHIVDHSAMGTPEVPESVKQKIRNAFDNTIIYSGGLDKEKAEQRLQGDDKGIAAFGRPYLANPDLVERMKQDAELNQPDMDTFYTPGEKGYTDYPTMSAN